MDTAAIKQTALSASMIRRGKVAHSTNRLGETG